MFIKEIINLDGYNFNIIVTDGAYELTCYQYFSTPIKSIIERLEVTEISSLFATKIMRIESEEYLIHKINNHYSYYLNGKVIDKQKSVVGIGEIRIKLDKPLPKDIEKGEFVEFEVERLDCSLD